MTNKEKVLSAISRARVEADEVTMTVLSASDEAINGLNFGELVYDIVDSVYAKCENATPSKNKDTKTLASSPTGVALSVICESMAIIAADLIFQTVEDALDSPPEGIEEVTPSILVEKMPIITTNAAVSSTIALLRTLQAMQDRIYIDAYECGEVAEKKITRISPPSLFYGSIKQKGGEK